MFKWKAQLIATTFIIFVVSLYLVNNYYLRYINIGKNDEITDWTVAIASDTKDLKDTQEINFKVEDNLNVVTGKIAPGLKAVANVTINLAGTRLPVDISAIIDDKNLNNNFKLTTKLDGEKYISETEKTIRIESNSTFTKENGNRILTLELEWINDDMENGNDTILGVMAGTIKIPVTINVKQHI